MKPTAATTPVITMAAITPPKIAPELLEPERIRKSHLAPTSLLRIESSITCDTVDGPETSKCGNITMLTASRYMLPSMILAYCKKYSFKSLSRSLLILLDFLKSRLSSAPLQWGSSYHNQCSSIPFCVLKVKLVPSSPMSPRKAPGFTVGSVSRKWSLRGGCCHDSSVQCFSILGLFLLCSPFGAETWFHTCISQNETKRSCFFYPLSLG